VGRDQFADLQSTGKGQLPIRTAVILFLFLNFLYLLTSTGRVHTIDEISAVIQTESLTLHGTTAVPQAVNSRVYYGKLDRSGHPRSPYPPGQPLVTVPWYALGHYVVSKFPGVSADIHDLIVSMTATWSNATFAALAGMVVFLLASSLGLATREALAAAFLIALATPLFVYSAWLFSEPLTAVLWLGSALALFGMPVDTTIHWKRAVIAGVLLGFSLHVRPTNLLAAFVFIAAVILRDRKRSMLAASALTAIVGFAGLMYLLRNYSLYGNVLDFGYPHIAEAGRELNTFHTPLFVGLYGFLLSPGKSILLYCPPVILATFGLPRLWRRDRGLALVCGLVPLVYLLFYATYTSWEGIYSYGPRYLVPGAALLCVSCVAWFFNPPAWFRRVFWVSFTIGTFIQLLGLSMNIVEDMVTHQYYDAQYNYQIGYSAIAGQFRLLAKYLGGADAPLGMGFDRWFLFVHRAGVPNTTVLLLMLPMVLGVAITGWMLYRESRRAD
jgi:hypothetical protein